MVKRGMGTRDEDLDHLAALLRLLSDKTRLNILMLLSEGERHVTSLCDLLKLPQPTVSHHLGLLRMSNLISGRRAGKQVFYAFDGRVTVENNNIELSSGAFSICIGETAPA